MLCLSYVPYSISRTDKASNYCPGWISKDLRWVTACNIAREQSNMREEVKKLFRPFLINSNVWWCPSYIWKPATLKSYLHIREDLCAEAKFRIGFCEITYTGFCVPYSVTRKMCRQCSLEPNVNAGIDSCEHLSRVTLRCAVYCKMLQTALHVTACKHMVD